MRELRSIPVAHVDGMSSDDEQTELEVTAFKLKLGMEIVESCFSPLNYPSGLWFSKIFITAFS